MADDLIGSPSVEDDETSNGNQSDPEQELLEPSEAATTWEPCNFPFMDEDDSSEDEFLNLSERLFASDSETDTEYENESNSLCEDCLNRANNDEDVMDTGSSSNDNDGAQNMTPEFSIESNEGNGNANVDTLIENLNDRTRLNIAQARAVRVRKPLYFMFYTSDKLFVIKHFISFLIRIGLYRFLITCMTSCSIEWQLVIAF